jgi:DNA-binding NarL/FixJ family response regulator
MNSTPHNPHTGHGAKYRILIADDHAVVRAGLRALIEREDRFEVIAEASDGEEAVEKARQLRPDVAVLDVRMPNASGIEACRQIVEALPDCRVIMLTSYAEDELLLAAIRAGAAGYVLKRIGSNNLVQAIRQVSQGENILDPSVAGAVFSEVRKAASERQNSAFAELTHKEVMVLALIADGHTNRQMSAQLFLGEGTVRNYVSSILSKLNLANRAEAAAYAVKHNIGQYLATRNA